MYTIYKYPLHGIGKTEILLPSASRILSAIFQDGRIVIYALIDTRESTLSEYSFYVSPTGEEIPRGWEYSQFLNTVPMYDSTIVAHVFCNYPQIQF